MRPGPKPKMATLQKLAGGKGKKGFSKPKPSRPISPECPPDYLDDIGKAKWRELAGELAAQNILTTWDYDVFAVYCEAFSKWRLANEQLQEAKSYLAANQQISAWVTILNQSRKDMLRFGSLLGLNPGDRSRLNASAIGTLGISEACFDFGMMPDGSEIPQWALDARHKQLEREREVYGENPDPGGSKKMAEMQRKAIEDFDRQQAREKGGKL